MKNANGTFSGGGVSGLKVMGMMPKRLPFRLSVYIVTVPPRMVEVEPSSALTWPVVPAGPVVSWWRSLMSMVSAVNFSTFLTVPLYVFTSTMPW